MVMLKRILRGVSGFYGKTPLKQFIRITIASSTKAAFVGSLASTIIIFIIYFLLPFNKWNGYFSPDSEFYLSLSVFGSELTGKVVNPAYYWTRSGQIIPEHFVTTLFGWNLGLQLAQFGKILTIAISVFYIFYVSSKKILVSLFFMTMILLNGTLLTMLGNTYLTISAMSIISVFFALVRSNLDSLHLNNKQNFFSLVGLATLISFSVFVYPILTFQLGLILITTFIWVILSRIPHKQHFAVILIIFVCCLILSFSIFLTITESFFPNLNWIETVLFYINNLNPADYSNDDRYSILLDDFSLFVILVSLVASLKIVYRRFDFSPFANCLAYAQFGLILVTLLQVQFLDSVFLEASQFSAFLWIPSLLIVGLFLIEANLGSFVKRVRSNLIFPLMIFLLFLLRWLSDEFFRYNASSAFINTFLFLILAIYIFFEKILRSKISTTSHIAIALSFFLIFAHFQNTRNLSSAAVGRVPYFNSIEDRDFELAKTHVGLQRTILSNLDATEKAVVWTPAAAGLVTYAAMNFWGPNSISLGDSMNVSEANYFRVLKPQKLFVFISQAGDDSTFLNSLGDYDIRHQLEFSEKFLDSNGSSFTVHVYSLKFP